MTAPMPCATCTQPATHDADAGWVRIGGQWIAQTRPLCAPCGWADAIERAESRAS